MNIRSLFYSLILLFLTSHSVAQEEDAPERNYDLLSTVKDSVAAEKGSMRFIQDGRIETFNEYLKSYPPMHTGYRIQLVFGSKASVQSARSSYQSRWSLPAYETYLAPNFRLRVGDFMTRLQAEKALAEMKSKFPAAYIVKDKIEVPSEFR